MKTDLKHWITALELAKHVVDAKASLPCLAQVAIEAKGGKLCIKATDLQREVRIRLDADAGDSDLRPLSVDHKAALALARAARKSGKTIALESLIPDGVTDPMGLKLQIGPRTFELEAMSTRDWPASRKVPDDDPYVACFDAGKLDRALAYVLPAVCRDETRFHLAGVRFAEDGMLCSTDGHRLHMVHDVGALIGPDDKSTLGLTSTVGSLLRAAIAKARPAYAMARAWEGFWELHLQGPSIEVLVREKPIDSAFPPIDQIIPKHTMAFTTPRRLLADSLETAVKVMKATGEDVSRKGIRVTANGDLRLQTDNFLEVLTLAKASPELATLGLNPGYLAEALADGDELCEIRFGSEDKDKKERLEPVLVRTGRSFEAVVMPMRIGG